MTDPTGFEEAEKKYGHLVVVAFCLTVVLVVVVAGIVDPWFRLRLQSDFWPIDKATVAPNILASFIIVDLATLAAALFYPPFKKAMDRAFSRAAAKGHAEVKEHITAELSHIHDKLDAHHAEHVVLAKAHHAEHMESLRPAKGPAKKVTPVRPRKGKD